MTLCMLKSTVGSAVFLRVGDRGYCYALFCSVEC